MKKPTKAMRSLSSIIGEIRKTFSNDIANIIKRGELLIEAKEMLGQHGEWLPRLEQNFEMSPRTAQRAMAVAEFAKNVSLTDLRLTRSALYELSSGDWPENVVRAALKEAESKLVNDFRLDDINVELNPGPEPVEETEPFNGQKPSEWLQAEHEAWQQQKAEAEAILDGPAPELPPPPEILPPVDYQLERFNNVIKTLGELQTKSLTRFASTTHSTDDLEKAADFLCAVAELITGKETVESSTSGARVLRIGGR